MEKKHIVISLGIIIFMVIVILIYNLVVKKNASNNITDPTNTNTPIVVPTTTTGTVLCTRIKHGDKYLDKCVVKDGIMTNEDNIVYSFNENSLIKCIMFKSYATKLTFMPKDGMKVIAYDVPGRKKSKITSLEYGCHFTPK